MSPPGGARTSSWQMPFGATSAAHTLAQNAQRHFHRYGTTRETLGWIALNQRANAALNPTAIYRDPMTMDDYLNARMITTPFGLYDCDVPCDGAIAVIVSAVDVAKRHAKHARAVRGGRHADHRTDRLGPDHADPRAAGARPVRAHVDANVVAAQGRRRRRALRRLHVQLPVVAGGARASAASARPRTSSTAARTSPATACIPLNTHGGQLSHGRTHGMGLIHEAVVQLRGEAGERQVAGRPRRGGQQRRPDAQRRDAAADATRDAAAPRPPRRPRRRRADVGAGRVGARAEGGDRRGPRRRHVGGVFRLPRPSRTVLAARGRGQRLHGDRTGPSRLRRVGVLPRRHDRADRRVGFARRRGQDPRRESRGAGLFLLAHSAGCELGLRMAADERADVLGVELAGTGLRYGAEAKAVISEATATSRPAGLRDLLWQPTDLYPPEVLTGGLSAPGAPYEAEVTANWPRRDFPAVAAGSTCRSSSAWPTTSASGSRHRRRWPSHRRVVHVVAAGRRQRNARQRTQSQRRLERRRLPPAGAVVRRGMCCRADERI